MKRVHTVIIGAGITGLSTAMPLYKKGLDFIILEKESRTGGQIFTKTYKGYVYETGPNTGSISHPEVLDIFDFVKKELLQKADNSAKNRWILKGNEFVPLPKGFVKSIRTPLFTLKDKFRLLGEPFRRKGTDPNESVGALAERRLGKSFVDYAVDPFVGGIYAADPYQLTTRYALPKLYNLEQSYGSFILGAFKKMKEKKSERDKLATNEVFSSKGGLSSLVNALSNIYDSTESIRLSVKDIKITPRGKNDFVVKYTSPQIEEEICCQHIVTTVGAYELPHILNFDDLPEYHKYIDNLFYAYVVEVQIGFDSYKGIPLNAFGGLIPSKENRQVLGILFPSSCFCDRTPSGKEKLITVFMGGMRDGDKLSVLSDEQLKNIALAEVQDILKIDLYKSTLAFVDISRHIRAIPQYDKTMEKRLEVINLIESKYKGLHIAGNIKDGIGLSHRISQGIKLGTEISK